MTKSPKLPINVRRGSLDSGRWYIVDGDEIPLDLGGHLGQVVVDALTADAEQTPRQQFEAACPNEHRDGLCLKCGWTPDALGDTK